jgi:hypothetical protein
MANHYVLFVYCRKFINQNNLVRINQWELIKKMYSFGQSYLAITIIDQFLIFEVPNYTFGWMECVSVCHSKIFSKKLIEVFYRKKTTMEIYKKNSILKIKYIGKNYRFKTEPHFYSL